MVTLSNVRFGRTNADVRTVQKALIARGRKIPDGATGTFGPQTKAAYRAEQLAQGFKGADADGNPGCASLTTLGHHAGFAVDCADAGRPAKKPHIPSPVPGHRVTFGFYARGPYQWKPDGVGRHTGQDFAADTGTPVVAVRGGSIAWSNKAGGAYGQWIGLRADNGHIYTYCHLSQRQVRTGQKVTAGQQLGEVGTTGNVTGPHLHFEMSKGSSWSYGNVAKPSW
ncbi:peptidoglycan DD-metalloendopeptidase family protein [Streptomyces sp. NBC_00582]|uniref:peptidoglycan DD-metalloendopeptidase family protein n=1 Tax=Streptomyces sp. NBC_00582 TaxID=2975783 RepID=UPI002E81BED5|nr:peptidoglycan DD-metalloendopeptidase family protein [Streptomyces sp. NBC_00582]WUB62476.1 peptidoglycan DD-metalloendopeptidase family protein [Streptomyces sp. NBC_00582]